jgi:hypothetical protein
MHAPFWHASSSRWRCQVCLASSANELYGICPGSLPAESRHVLWTLKHFTFCHTCGAHTSTRKVYLGAACHGRNASKSLQVCGKRLREGRHPGTDKYLGNPAPIGCLPLPRASKLFALEVEDEPDAEMNQAP